MNLRRLARVRELELRRSVYEKRKIPLEKPMSERMRLKALRKEAKGRGTLFS